ncbi:hypothetical protein Bca4012_091991 [Brassica carinata]
MVSIDGNRLTAHKPYTYRVVHDQLMLLANTNTQLSGLFPKLCVHTVLLKFTLPICYIGHPFLFSSRVSSQPELPGSDAFVEDAKARPLQTYLKDLVGRTYTFKLKLFEFKFSSSKHQSLTTARTFDDNERQPMPNFAEHARATHCLYVLLMVRPEKPLRPTVALMLLMVEGTAAATPTLPTHMELMLR